MIEITDRAKERINDILYDQGKSNIFFRTFVQGGGCAGFNYGFSLDDQKHDDDFEFETGPFKVLIDSISLQYLEGSTLDYKEELLSNSFVIMNPNAKTHCGCGSSFSI